VCVRVPWLLRADQRVCTLRARRMAGALAGASLLPLRAAAAALHHPRRAMHASASRRV
jgi:hypothetical protein